MFAKILVGVDGSELAEKAVDAAGGIARGLPRCEVEICHVEEVPILLAGVPVDPSTEADRLVNEAVEKLQADGVDARGNVRQSTVGGPAKVLVEEAKAFGADLIVLGSRGTSNWAALLVGSVTHKVLHYADCAVLVVR